MKTSFTVLAFVLGALSGLYNADAQNILEESRSVEDLIPVEMKFCMGSYRIGSHWLSEEELQEAFAALKHAKNQERLLLAYLDLSHALTPERRTEVSRKELLERSGCKITSLSGLLRRGILESYAKEVSRLQIHVCKPQELWLVRYWCCTC